MSAEVIILLTLAGAGASTLAGSTPQAGAGAALVVSGLLWALGRPVAPGLGGPEMDAVLKKARWTDGKRIESNADAVLAVRRALELAATEDTSRQKYFHATARNIAAESKWRLKTAVAVLSWGMSKLPPSVPKARAWLQQALDATQRLQTTAKRTRRSDRQQRAARAIHTGVDIYAQTRANMTAPAAAADPAPPSSAELLPAGMPSWLVPVGVGVAGLLVLGVMVLGVQSGGRR